ncbi:MAG: transcriptional regulator [Phenylobacterium sp.]|uniref:winged helix-turn-helix transcriptional regulator n=1 Tax=Phenylobacterium sp. TaxID=1871053 RepID=UPI0025DFEB37|nr:helix-turn-helix domain-containing protein [Phenylobacterium sp.]MBI1196251.1 transcriptional regulator [Phenylobacterium sp.]
MALKLRKNRSAPLPAACGGRKALVLLGRAWTLAVVWKLSGGPRRFSELRLDLPQITPKVLTTRLRELEAEGLVRRTEVATSPPTVEYALTELGEALMNPLEAIVALGLRLG